MDAMSLPGKSNPSNPLQGQTQVPLQIHHIGHVPFRTQFTVAGFSEMQVQQ